MSGNFIRRSWSIFFLFLTVAMFFMGRVKAQEDEKTNFCLGFKIGGAISLADIDFDNRFDGAYADVKLDEMFMRDGFTLGMSFRYSIFDWLFVGANLDYGTFRMASVKIDINNVRSEENFGRVYLIGLSPVVEFRVPFSYNENRIAPYLFVGAGINLNIWQDSKDAQMDTEVDNGFGLLMGTGIEFFATTNLSFIFEFSWHNYVEDFETKRKNDVKKYSGEMDLSDVRITAGARFHF